MILQCILLVLNFSDEFTILQSNTEQEATRTLGGHELIEVEQGMKTDPDECCGNREVAKQWAVFPGGMLK